MDDGQRIMDWGQGTGDMGRRTINGKTNNAKSASRMLPLLSPLLSRGTVMRYALRVVHRASYAVGYLCAGYLPDR